MTIMKHRGPIWMGWDVHKDSIAAGILGEGEARPARPVTSCTGC